ncbi:hypothetical protein C2845_PM10G08780 [Panicum miliaceum]|uniref:Uncharacterized protein n=1 Tax=Panicum miliaceum TaxID=4540 RepID=A0A3L6PCF3_PANMI|nr:hypothetical protein C2845_PM10G08780 [Panicum miliaceum]
MDVMEDLPSQLAQATTYIKDLQERVEKLKQRRDECYAKVQKSSSGNAANEAALESSHRMFRYNPQEQLIFDVNLTMN